LIDSSFLPRLALLGGQPEVGMEEVKSLLWLLLAESLGSLAPITFHAPCVAGNTTDQA
jgi:hypothetical protein